MVTLVIGGDVLPDIGDVFIYGISIVPHPRMAHLGVCPAFDFQLSVLIVYERLKGLQKGHELEKSEQYSKVLL